jgi:Mrp family chromosome partitioning ATPase
MTAEEAGNWAGVARLEGGLPSTLRSGKDVRRNIWEHLRFLDIDESRIGFCHPSSEAFVHTIRDSIEALTTRIQHARQQYGWSSVLVTAPAPGCGKTTLCANLAIALSQRAGCRVALVDLDTRRSHLLQFLGANHVGEISPLRVGAPNLQEQFRCLERNLAVAASTAPIPPNAVLPDGTNFKLALAAIKSELDPNFVIVNGAPGGPASDIVAVAQCVDCVMIVAAAGQSTLPEVANCIRRLSEHANIVGVVLNKVHGTIGLGEGA